ncbi:MAG: hypothetical protein DIZ78_06375 [endosymbiont of Escarpia spicata]|uniref:CN hydrolase domain-containing protein n=1 Tax=endosymbiont of Escarpia spicata TaxID=2200908 RepID=A0A370DQ88_9GAMM|nr:MAG: hypothetical protein DIZ78_06375 [endosymbiont of Escarpia spicata]
MDSMKKNNIGLDLLALLAGVALVFAFAPFHLPWLALESGKPMLHATNKGISAIIGPRGRLVETRSDGESWFDGSIQPRRGKTPYTAWGEWPLLLLMITPLLLALAAKIRIIRYTSFSTHKTSMPIASMVE